MTGAAGAWLASIPSPPQGVWYVGPIALRAYAVCIIAGIIVAIWWGNKRFVARGGRPGRVTDIAVFAVPFGLVGGRLYHVITDAQLYFGEGRNPWNAFAIWNGGLGVWGAIALGGVGAWIGCRYYRVPLGAFGDAIAPGVAVAQGIGRLGNYFNQELFGSPSTLPWALEVYVRTPGGVPGTLPADGASCEYATDFVKASPELVCGTFQPAFLYELLWTFGVAAVVVWADRRFRLGGGRAFALYVAGYTVGRTWIELLRIDPANTFLGVRINVFVSVLVFLGAVAFLIARRGVPREDPALVWGGRDGDEARPAQVGPDVEAGAAADSAGPAAPGRAGTTRDAARPTAADSSADGAGDDDVDGPADLVVGPGEGTAPDRDARPDGEQPDRAGRARGVAEQ